MRPEFVEAGARSATSYHQRIKHVRKEHSAPNCRSECGPGSSWSTRARETPTTFNPGDRRNDSRYGFTATRDFPILRRDTALARHHGTREEDANSFSSGRDSSRHELA